VSVSILTIDDETDITDLFRQHFRREVRQGIYVLHLTCSADEALAKLADGIRPQLIVILSDINMPAWDGLTLLREIKKWWPDIPVMMGLPPMAMTDAAAKPASSAPASSSSSPKSIPLA
jgi:CheY-like chemotaxis protein